MKKLLELKEKMKKVAPNFTRADSHKKDRLKGKWRRPKGLQNKMRLQVRGYKRIVKQGYMTPSKVKGMDKDGLYGVLVSNVSQLKELDKKTQKVIISSKLGAKKRLMIIEEAKKLNLTIANYKDAGKYVKDLSSKLETGRKEKKDKKAARAKRQEESKKDKKKDEKKTVEEKVSDEEKKKQEKKEKDKVLMQKEG